MYVYGSLLCMGHYDPSAPDVPVLHTGEFVLTHVLKVAESGGGRMRGQHKWEKYSGELQTILSSLV